MARNLVDPRLLAALADAFPQTATFSDAYVTQDVYGAEETVWSARPFLVDEDGAYFVTDAGDLLTEGEDDIITCCIWPAKGQEVRRPDQTLTIATHHALLAGYRGDLTTEARVAIGGTTYDILAVQHDSQRLATRLLLEIVT
jgi:hypothetical protein